MAIESGAVYRVVKKINWSTGKRNTLKIFCKSLDAAAVLRGNTAEFLTFTDT